MKVYQKSSVMIAIIMLLFYFNCVNIWAGIQEDYERDYMKRVFNSENGLEGTAVNCVLAAEDGFLWIGGYTGLFEYDGSEFKKHLIDDRAIAVNDLIQDQAGNIWVGTNGDGVFWYDGTQFSVCETDSEESGSSTVNELMIDTQERVWIGTKAGLFLADCSSEKKTAKSVAGFEGLNIKDVTEISKEKMLVIEKDGTTSFLEDGRIQKLDFSQLDAQNKPRCCGIGTDHSIYIGSDGTQILKMSDSGKITAVIDTGNLETINGIYEYQDGTYWVCSDTGIGVLENDTITQMDFPMKDSIEEVCCDYQGNFWFASSRQGLLQLYENYFSDLGAYLGINQPVNCIKQYENKLYIGCDNGLFCFKDKEPEQNQLTKACEGMRIRQLYIDRDQNLWVATYQYGIQKMDLNHKIVCFNKDNSGLHTNQIRCMYQKKDGDILIGSEEGIFIYHNGEIQHLNVEEPLNSKRILDVREAKNGKIYAATDGYGVYAVEKETIESAYTKQQGLESNIVMKVVPSERLDGVWAVTGSGICLIGEDGTIQKVKNIPIANALDMLLLDDGNALILAGNGLFKVKEETLLEKHVSSYEQFDRQDGLPIDFTANSWSCVQKDKLYMCGTTGLSGMDVHKKRTAKPVYLYVNEVQGDGKALKKSKDKIFVPSGVNRLTVDVRFINYVYQDFYISYFMEGVDQKPTVVENPDKMQISYTNLNGGNYTYDFKLLDPYTSESVAEISIPIQKNYRFLEQPVVKMLLSFLLFFLFIFICILWSLIREKKIKKKYQKQYLKEKEEEISRLAYRDLATGVYNRNCFEEEKQKTDAEELDAVVLVSVNYSEYLKNKYGILHMEEILRKAVQILFDCEEREKMKIYRISDRVFCIFFLTPVQLETYIRHIKNEFKKSGEAEGMTLSFAVGAVYNNRIEKEKVEDLVERCEKMRLLDEKHEEAKFIEGKLKILD